MTTATLTQFEVVGRGRFPIDMLRQDSCWPRCETDSNAIDHPFEHRSDDGNVHVFLEGAGAPTVDRWESLGWRVTVSV